MATTPPDDVIASGSYLRQGKILSDITRAITADTPTYNARQLAEKLKIRQVCNFQTELEQDVAKKTPDSLGGYIKQYVRNNTSDTTELPAAARMLFNSTDMQSNRSTTLMRRPGNDATFRLNLAEERKIVTNFATKEPIWATGPATPGEITFTKPGNILVNINAMFGVAFSDTDTELNPIVWRFSDTGTNRFVIITPYIELRGALSTGLPTMRLNLGELAIYPEDIISRKRVPFSSSLQFQVMSDDGVFGKVEGISFHIERSTWVGTVNGAMDGVGLFKQSLAGLPDTSNYMELIEL